MCSMNLPLVLTLTSLEAAYFYASRISRRFSFLYSKSLNLLLFYHPVLVADILLMNSALAGGVSMAFKISGERGAPFMNYISRVKSGISPSSITESISMMLFSGIISSGSFGISSTSLAYFPPGLLPYADFFSGTFDGLAASLLSSILPAGSGCFWLSIVLYFWSWSRRSMFFVK